MPQTAHFYHLWADGHWKVPVHEHLRALRDAKYDGEVHLGLVGTPENQDEAERYAAKFWSPALLRVCARAPSGYEQVTLSALHEYVHRDDAAPYVLYCHTKGAFEESVPRDLWRESMTQLLVRKWNSCVPMLESYDAVGLHWLTAQEHPGRNITTPFFGGNFWWARTDYLRKLPPVATGSRFDAESWIGLENPRVANLRGGWPPYEG